MQSFKSGSNTLTLVSGILDNKQELLIALSVYGYSLVREFTHCSCVSLGSYVILGKENLLIRPILIDRHNPSLTQTKPAAKIMAGFFVLVGVRWRIGGRSAEAATKIRVPVPARSGFRLSTCFTICHCEH